MQIVQDDEPTIRFNLVAVARFLFWAGALVSLLDALLTWMALSQFGPGHPVVGRGGQEANAFSAWAIDRYGLTTFCVARFLTGAFMFWLGANTMAGRHYFTTKWEAQRYQHRIARWRSNDLSIWSRPRRWWSTDGPAIMLVFGFTLTAIIAGNNYHALKTLLLYRAQSLG